MSDQDLLPRLWEQLRAVAAPLTAAAGSPAARAELAQRLGWDLVALGDELGVGDLSRLDAHLGDWVTSVQTALDRVEGVLAGGMPDSLADLAELGKVAGGVGKALSGLPQPWKAAGVDPALLGRMGEDLLDHLADAYLCEHAPVLRRVLALLGIVVPAEEAGYGVAQPSTGAPVRLPVRRSELHPELIGALLRDPVATLRGLYGWTGGESANAVADKLFPRVVALCTELGLDAFYGVKPGAAPDPGAISTELAAHMLTVRGTIGHGTARADWGLSIGLSTADTGGLGVVVVPHGEIALAAALGGWNLTATVGAGGAPFAVSGDGLVVDGTSAEVDLELVAAKRKTGDAPAFRVGAADGTRLEIGDFAVKAFGKLRVDGDHDYGISVVADNAALVLVPGADADSFLNKVLPAQGMRIALAAGLAWSRSAGLTVAGGVGTETTLPLHLDLGPITIDGVKVALTGSADDKGLRATATADVRFTLGPVIGVIDDIGAHADLTFPDGGGNLGPANAAVSFAPPKGIALRVESGVVNGAGFLAIDPEHGRYAGGVDLQFAKLRLSALGLLTTKMPDGSPGFSLLVLVNARFPQPVPLGFGFGLGGVGGLLGINRSVDVARMRAGLRSGALTAVLSPGDALGAQASLLADLEGLFPVTPGRFVFGPTARLTWGTPVVLTADLGLALELPSPARLLAAGRIKVLLPDPAAPAVVINMDALGVLDFGAGTLSLDATLYDSTLAGWQLSGDMALRAAWSGSGDFALSVGGFHPRFTPPAGFPALRRVSLSIGDDAVHVRLSSYLALTANTLQLGARAELAATLSSFSAQGVFTFDALVHFQPFEFEVDFTAKVAVRWHGHLLLGVDAAVFLSGPGRWHARGDATVHVLFLHAKVHFDEQFGDAPPVAPVPGQDVAALVRAALAEPGAWSVLDQPDAPTAVSLRPGASAPGLLVSPGAWITVRQKVAPLGGTVLDHFGQAPVLGDTAVSIDAATLGGADTDIAVVRDPFAAAQFQNLSDEEKLVHQPFDPMPSGVEFKATSALLRDTAGPAPVAVAYQSKVIDAPSPTVMAFNPRPFPSPSPTPPDDEYPDPYTHPDPLPGPAPTPRPLPEPTPAPAPPVADFTLSGAALDVLAAGGAAGRSQTRNSGTERFAGAPSLPLSVHGEEFLLVSADRLRPAGPQPPPGERWSRTEATDQLRRYLADHEVVNEPLIVMAAAEATRPEGDSR